MKACSSGCDEYGELVCQYCRVPYEQARRPIDMTQTLMTGHNRTRMTCYFCVRWFIEEGRRSKERPIPSPPWSPQP